VIRFDDIDFKRPGDGIAADEYSRVIGRNLTCDVEIDRVLRWEYFE
jgi:sialic acid synthase SpsE